MEDINSNFALFSDFIIYIISFFTIEVNNYFLLNLFLDLIIIIVVIIVIKCAKEGPKMITLLVIIYLAFISLGLPDSLLGSTWPAMRLTLNAPLSMAGILSMFISGCTIISSLNSARLIQRFKTSRITLVSVFLTAAALMGYSFAPSVIWLFLLAIPLGLGAGAIDSGLNNFVALHYEAKHMSWLHCFWGIGATLGPVIISCFLNNDNNWRGGYRIISIIQFVLVIALVISLPKWKVVENKNSETEKKEDKFITNREAIKIRGAKWALLTFICYCSVETTTGLWSSTFLTQNKGLSTATAAAIVSLYYAGITIGRGMGGFLTLKFKPNTLILSGCVVSSCGMVLYMLPLHTFFSAVALIMIGVGFAPIFPNMLQETPVRFGKKASQTMMGLQMGFAYIGSTITPLVFGFLADKIGSFLLPYFLLAVTLLLIISVSQVIRVKYKEEN